MEMIKDIDITVEQIDHLIDEYCDAICRIDPADPVADAMREIVRNLEEMRKDLLNNNKANAQH